MNRFKIVNMKIEGLAGPVAMEATGTGLTQREGEWFVDLDHPMFASLHPFYLAPLDEEAAVMLRDAKTRGVA